MYGSSRRHRGGMWGSPRYSRGPRGYGSYGMRGGYGSPFGGRRPRGRVQVRGCGCCLPIPLGIVTASGLGLRALIRSRA